MDERKHSWVDTAKTILLTVVFTSAVWAIGIAYYLLVHNPAALHRPHVDSQADVSGEPVEAVPTESTSVTPAPSPDEKLSQSATPLLIPVRGVAARDLADTFTQARAGGARVHDAIDIMADDGTPVVAAAPGIVEKLYFSEGGGGITAYVRSPDKLWIYYYAHLEGYAPGLKEGDTLQRGDPVGAVGSTGNASPDGPHLHFAVHRMEEGEGWWQGTAVNPYPLLTSR